MFDVLEKINQRPEPFHIYTARELWTDTHTSAQMLGFHLDGAIDVSSRNAAFIERSVEWIADRFDIEKGLKIADFGCGPGLYAMRLAQRGAEVTGIDFSERSIAYAKQVAARRRRQIHYVHQDYLDFETDDRFDLVCMIMCDFCALSPVQRKQMLHKFRNLLQPKGHVLLDVYSMEAFEQRKETAAYALNLLDGFWSPNRYYGFLNTFKYDAEKVVLDKYTIVESDRIRTVYNWLQYFSPADLEREFAESGFRVKAIFSDVAGKPYEKGSQEFAVIAESVRKEGRYD